MRTLTLLRTGAIIALGLTITPAVYAASFSDVSDSPNKTAIQFLKTKGMIHGYGNGTFKPNTTVNRAELSKILVTATGVNPSVDQYHDCFSDVKKEWFAPFVCYAKGRGWVVGYGDNTFRPANLVSTVEAIKMILQAQGIAVSVSASDTAFSDVDFNAWYASYVATANRKGLLEITNGRLNVNANMKRGGIAEMMYRSLFIKALGAAKFNDGLALGMHAQELGITTNELKDELDDGKTLQQIAQECGVTLPLPTENHGDWVRSSNESSRSSSSSTSSSSTSSSSSSENES